MARISRKLTLTEKQSAVLKEIATSRTNGFTKKYDVHQLVYYEVHSDVYEAITREKHIKKWNRQWKINLIEQQNPHWINLANGLH